MEGKKHSKAFCSNALNDCLTLRRNFLGNGYKLIQKPFIVFAE